MTWLHESLQSAGLQRRITGLLRRRAMAAGYPITQGHDWVMLVNLNLERSANVKIATAKTYRTKQVVSAEDGRLLPFDEQNGHWLLAGHGTLIKLE